MLRQLLGGLLAVILGATVITGATPAEANANAASPPWNTPIRIKVKQNGKCLSVQHGNTYEGARIVQSTCTGAEHEKLTISTGAIGTVIRTFTGKCFNVEGNDSSDYAKIIQYRCSTSSDYPRWFNEVMTISRPGGTGEFFEINPQTRYAGRCVTVFHASNDDNTHMIQHVCNGGDNQRFTWERA
ncbi:RICIN domain-containing protein [Nonomuraea longicatena]|uniref:Ricin B lectin domain-containing protein n=1 Tax=Nonomuraea longicatena TaxID=83682 RepID=A0ABN1PMG4_9ACTN